MDHWDAITSRRNVRQFADQPISDGDLRKILEAGRRSPSARNSQPWDLVVVRDEGTLAELAGVWRGAWMVADSAATVAIIAAEPDSDQRDTLFYDLGQLTIMMMLAATGLGIGSAHASVQDQDLARRLLGHPKDRFCARLLAFGVPADGPVRPLARIDRRPLEDVVHWERW